MGLSDQLAILNVGRYRDWSKKFTEENSKPAIYAFDAAIKVIETAIQVHGGLGFTWEMGIHVYLRHATALRDLALEILN